MLKFRADSLSNNPIYRLALADTDFKNTNNRNHPGESQNVSTNSKKIDVEIPIKMAVLLPKLKKIPH